MAPFLLVSRHDPTEGTGEPLVGLVVSVVLSMLSISTLSAFITQRYLAVRTWKQLPLVQWLVFAIYSDSFLFVLGTGILQFGLGVGYSGSVCESAILLCLVCYVTTKILIYLFLVEKAYVIRSGNKKPRLKSRLYLFNSFGVIGAYCIAVVPNFVLRFARVEDGECIIGMQRPAMIPLIVFDLLVNIYLTIIFLKPLSRLYSYKNFDRAPGSRKLRTMAIRTFVGCICTLVSSIVNLSVLVGLNGEPGWVCLMCCNSDILFSATVINWVTSRDSTTTNNITDDNTSPGPRSHNGNPGGEELSPIPARAALHRLSSGDDEDQIVDAKRSISRRSQLTLSTEAMVPPNDDDEAKPSLDEADCISSVSFSSSAPPHRHSTSTFPSPPPPIATPTTTITTTSELPRHHPPQPLPPTPTRPATATTPAKQNPTTTLKQLIHHPKPPKAALLLLQNTTNNHAHGHAHARSRAASEVRVDVDYGATITTTSIAVTNTSGSRLQGAGVRGGAGAGQVQMQMQMQMQMGNSVVIGCGTGSGAGSGSGGVGGARGSIAKDTGKSSVSADGCGGGGGGGESGGEAEKRSSRSGRWLYG